MIDLEKKSKKKGRKKIKKRKHFLSRKKDNCS